MRETVALPVSDPSRTGEARRIAATLAERAGFDDVGRGRVALVATELANNLIQHAGGGELVLSLVHGRGVGGVEVLSLDKGPGMADFARCRVDGYSTGGTPGNGLGAVARVADEFDAETGPGRGSVLWARLWASARPPAPPGGELEWGGVCLPVAGELECGDGWAVVEESPWKSTVMVVDGLGHGPPAAEAADRALGVMQGAAGLPPADVVRLAHEALKGTRGAALSVASIDRGRREVRFCGVGNIAAAVLGVDARHGLISLSGIVGLEIRKPQEFAQPWPDGALMVLHSDGITARWKLDRRTPLASRPAPLVAGALYRDHSRGRDDSTVVVARDRRRPPS